MSEQYIFRGRYRAALIIIAIGVLFLLSNLEMLNLRYLVRTYWPSIFIIIGLTNLVSSRHGISTGAILFILIGVFLQANKLGWLGWEWYQYWPILLIVIGFWILIKPRSQRWWPGNKIDSDSFDMFTIFSGAHRTIQSTNFRGGDATAVMGGIDLDLRPARTTEREVRLNVTAFMGGIEIRVPQEWKVDLHVTPILGGVEDTRHIISTNQSDPMPTLSIHGTAILGGIKIKD